MTITFALMLVAAILLLCAGVGVPNSSKASLGWLGMFFWILSLLFGGYVK